MTDWLGWGFGIMGVVFGLFVAPPQLWKILKTGRVDGISRLTYTFLVLALIFYLLHAIYISSIVFIVAQSINLITNSVILVYLLRRKDE